jgi:hypothetical protein
MLSSPSGDDPVPVSGLEGALAGERVAAGVMGGGVGGGAGGGEGGGGGADGGYAEGARGGGAGEGGGGGGHATAVGAATGAEREGGGGGGVRGGGGGRLAPLQFALALPVFVLVALVTTLRRKLAGNDPGRKNAVASDASFFGSSGIWTAPLTKVIMALISCIVWGYTCIRLVDQHDAYWPDATVLAPGGVQRGDIRANPCFSFQDVRNTSGPDVCSALCNRTSRCTFWRFADVPPIPPNWPERRVCSLHEGGISHVYVSAEFSGDSFLRANQGPRFFGIKSDTPLDAYLGQIDGPGGGGCYHGNSWKDFIVIPAAFLTLFAALCLHGWRCSLCSSLGGGRAAAQLCVLLVVPLLVISACLTAGWTHHPLPEEDSDPDYYAWRGRELRVSFLRAASLGVTGFCTLMLLVRPRRSLWWICGGLFLHGTSQVAIAVIKAGHQEPAENWGWRAHTSWERYERTRLISSIANAAIALSAMFTVLGLNFRFKRAQKKARDGMKRAKAAYDVEWQELEGQAAVLNDIFDGAEENWKNQVQRLEEKWNDQCTELAKWFGIFPASDFVELYRQAHDVQPALLRRAGRWAHTHNGTHVCGQVKSPERALQKTFRSYGGDSRKLCDLARTTIVFENFEDMKECLKTIIGSQGKQMFAKIATLGQTKKEQNRFHRRYNEKGGNADGYRDMQLRIGIDGHVCEIQMHIDLMHELKDNEAHSKYTKFRDLMAK